MESRINKNKAHIQVVIATHKPYQMPDDSLYLPLQVGAWGKDGIGYRRDDEGVNISELNPFFCELTGLFWAWKNLSTDYIGLVHYRRHFSFHPYDKDHWKSILKEAELQPYLGKIRLFVPKKRKYYIETLYSHYAHTHYAPQLDETRTIIAEKFPDYLACYDQVTQRRWGHMFNMLIAQRDLLSDYCAWLFDILFELRNRIGKEQEQQLNQYQGRFYGRISEIIFNVWLDQKIRTGRLKTNEIMEIPFVYMEKVSKWKKGTAFLKAKYIGEKYQGSF